MAATGVVSPSVPMLPMLLVVLGMARWAPSVVIIKIIGVITIIDNIIVVIIIILIIVVINIPMSLVVLGTAQCAPSIFLGSCFIVLSQVHIWSVLTGASETVLRGHTSPAAAAVRKEFETFSLLSKMNPFSWFRLGTPAEVQFCQWTKAKLQFSGFNLSETFVITLMMWLSSN